MMEGLKNVKDNGNSESCQNDDIMQIQVTRNKAKTSPSKAQLTKSKTENMKRNRNSSQNDEKEHIPQKKMKESLKEVEMDRKLEIKKNDKNKAEVKAELSNKFTKKETKTQVLSSKKNPNEVDDVWKWWEENDAKEDGIKWKTLIHRGPLFAPPYKPLPKSIQFKYNGEPMILNPEAEEVAPFYARLLEHEYTTKEIFNENFFKDWRKTMTSEEREKIKDLKKCDFRQIHEHNHILKKEQKLKLKEEHERAEIKIEGRT